MRLRSLTIVAHHMLERDSMSDTQIIQGIVPVEKQDVVLLLEAGYLLMELAKHKEAEEVFHGVSALAPNSEVPHMALGHLYFSQGRLNPALKSHQKAVQLNPASAAAHAAVGEALMFLRRHGEAIKALDKAIALEPNGPAAEFAHALKESHTLGVFS